MINRICRKKTKWKLKKTLSLTHDDNGGAVFFSENDNNHWIFVVVVVVGKMNNSYRQQQQQQSYITHFHNENDNIECERENLENSFGFQFLILDSNVDYFF